MIKAKYFYIFLALSNLLALFWIFINLINYGKSSFSLSVCMVKNISGYPCATCGTTRSILSFVSGDFSIAFFQNPFGVLASITIFILPFALLLDLFSQKKILYHLFHKMLTALNQSKYWISILTFFLLLWIWNLYKHFNDLET